MNKFAPLYLVALLAACSRAPEAPPAAAPATATPTVAPAPSPAPATASAAKRANATGVIQSIDTAARKVTIAHDAVPALGWSEMTMTFPAPDVDLSAFKAGDAVKFDVTATGMDGTITAMSKQ
jgi:Cu(I)/Ag(I) efflux system protein CusF